MSRYIDADALKESFRKQTVNVQEKIKDDVDAIVEAICKDIDLAPTVDAVPVVRCKECVHRDPEDHRCDCGGHEWIKGRVLPMPDDWFCADGERKDGAE